MRFSVSCLVLALALTSPGRGAVLEGTIELEDGRGISRGAVGEAVVTFEPAAGDSVSPPADPYEIVTEDKQFRPRVLVVPVGSRVRFPNRDPILHNVFSVSGENTFDVGLYGRGPGKTVTFEHPGLVRIFCNVHHSMVAYVLVVQTSHVTRPDPRGRFRLDGIPEGPGTLTLWHERADPVRREIRVPRKEDLDLALEITKPRVPKHLNKVGEPYRRGRRYR
ncbi:MAG: hypothetical protein R3234_10505 [Thermoanaerobaculia bacterium]|nr:hypothetical protein [Thermoanaerobaculia bacterium]